MPNPNRKPVRKTQARVNRRRTIKRTQTTARRPGVKKTQARVNQARTTAQRPRTTARPGVKKTQARVNQARSQRPAKLAGVSKPPRSGGRKPPPGFKR